MMVVAGIVFLLLLASFVIPQMLNPSAMEDVRGGANVDSGQQMSLILTHPFAYAGIVLKNIWTSFADYAFAEACYRLLGHLEPAPFRYLIPILVVFLIATDYTGKTEQEDKLETENGNLNFHWNVSGSYLDGTVRCVYCAGKYQYRWSSGKILQTITMDAVSGLQQ